MLLQHFLSVDYVKKMKKKKKKKKEDEMTHGNKMNLFLSNPLKMIEACVYVSIISSYCAELLNIFTCECLLL